MNECAWFFLLGVWVTWFIFSLLRLWEEHTLSHTTEQILDSIMSIPAMLIYIVCMAIVIICIVIAFPFMWLWKFFRNAVRGVSIDTWNKVKVPKYWVFGNFRLCYDNRAKALLNKVFLVRIVRTGDLVHVPALEERNRPQ